MASRRRGNGEGTITHRRDGRWEARYTAADGARKCLYGASQDEVRRKLTMLTRDRDRGLAPALQERQTVAQYLADWLPAIAPTLEPATIERYAEQIRLHIVPALGGLRLSSLTAQRLQLFYAERLEAGLARASVAHLHAVIHRALKHAVKLGILTVNVADRVTPPRPQTHEMQSLHREQAQALLTAVSGDRLEALYTLALATGMRQGELLGLRWEDVDLDTGTLQVRHTLHHATGSTWTLRDPKTARSRRRIHLSERTIEALRRHRARQLEERLALGIEWRDRDLVFTRADGCPLRGQHVYQRHLQPLLRRTGLPAIRFHDLRHTAATLLLLQGIHPKVVSELLGHSSVAITMDRYSHVLPSMQRDAAAAMEAVLWG